MEDIKYYTNLKKSAKSLVDVLVDDSYFSEIPTSWHVLVVDVENSTKAVADGKHQAINLTATGAIISVLNTIRKRDKSIEIPYFFGGDGATFIVPNILLEEVNLVLENYSLHIKKNTDFTLRVGHISVSKLKALRTNIRVLKHQLTNVLNIPIVLGNGLKKAEEIIKNNFVKIETVQFKEDLLNLEGMECRWKEINPTQNKKRVVCLLLDTDNEEKQRIIYREVLLKMDALFGTFEDRQPIKPNNLKLNFSLLKIWEEMKISLADKSFLYLFKNWTATVIGKWYFIFSKNGQEYLNQVGQLSHTFMLDGMINTVFTAKQDKIALFTTYLEELEKDGKVLFGMHVTHASVMSCYVVDRKTNHSHFVDGTEGGYTAAAKMYKQKLKN